MPFLQQNVFLGMRPEVFTGVDPETRLKLEHDNWFMAGRSARAMNTVFHRLGPYEVIHEIGRGGMALVVLATDTRTGRNVALKLVPIGISGEARDILEAEQLGAELQRQFSRDQHARPLSTSICRTSPATSSSAMEYLDGENLSDLIARGAVPVDRAVAIASELCAFLDAAHNFAAVIDGQPRRSVVSWRSQAAERAASRRRRGQGARLRHRQGAVTQPQGHAQRLRHQALSLARATRGRRRGE